MRYLCTKQLAAGGVVYHPGEVIPDGVILPERSGKLLKSGYLADLKENGGTPEGILEVTVQDVNSGGVLLVPVKGNGGETVAVPVTPGEILQVFSILQLGAEEGARVIADVTSENVLILLHAADSRKMVKNAAKEQAGKLFPTEDISKAPRGGNEASDHGMNGVDA